MPAQNILGRRVALGAGEETVYGVPATITEWYPVGPDVSIKEILNHLETGRLAQSRTVNKLDTALGTKRVEVEFGGAFPVIGYGVLLKHTFGKVTTITEVPGVYYHTYEVNQAGLFTGLTVQKHMDAYMETVTGCKIRSLTLEAKVNDFLRYKVSMVGKDVTRAPISGTPSVTLLAAQPYWTWRHGAFSYGGATYAITGIDITLTNELLDSEEAAYQLGSQTMTMLKTGMFTCEGTIKRRLLSDGENNLGTKFIDNASTKTYASGTITFTGAGIVPGTPHTVVITLDEMELDMPEVSNDAGLLTETIKFKCRFDGTTTPVRIITTDALPTPETATGGD